MSIVHSTVGVTDANDGSKKSVDNVTVNGNQRQATAIGGPQSTDTDSIAAVQATQPTGTEQALVVREAQKGQATSANSQPVVLASDQSAVPVSAAALPLPSGAATAAKQPAIGTAGTPSADVISIQGEAGMTAVKVDGSAVTQPVSVAAAVTVSQATAANLNATVTGTVGATQSGTWTVQPGNTANTTAWKVDGSAVTQPVSAASLPLPTGAATSANQSTVKAASTAAAATDTSSVVQISPNQPALTTPLNTQGAKTNNNAAPGATNSSTIPVLANAAPPSWTEGNAVMHSADLAGNLRVYSHPPNMLGYYMVNGRTGTYGGQAAGAPLFSMRWTDATRLCVITRVRVNVATTTAATVAGNAERELIIARSFTVSDSGGTAVTLTGNNNKMRTSMGTSLVGDMRFGQPLTAGTRTLDANPISSILSWLATNFVGIDIGSGGAAATGAAWTALGGLGMIPLLDAVNGQDYPIVLAQNEGIIIRIGKDAQPTSAVQQTYVNISWMEVNAY